MLFRRVLKGSFFNREVFRNFLQLLQGSLFEIFNSFYRRVFSAAECLFSGYNRMVLKLPKTIYVGTVQRNKNKNVDSRNKVLLLGLKLSISFLITKQYGIYRKEVHNLRKIQWKLPGTLYKKIHASELVLWIRTRNFLVRSDTDPWIRNWPFWQENLYNFRKFFSKYSNSSLLTYGSHFLRTS
jgi:hypothetical protein